LELILATALAISPQIVINEPLETTIVNEARIVGIDPTLALAIAQVESGMNPNVIGLHGERSSFQLHPKYHRVVKDERKNIRVALTYLKALETTCKGYPGLSYIACYNYGTARKLNHPMLFPYVQKVMKEMNRRKVQQYLVAG
jgi:hypothetical protein